MTAILSDPHTGRLLARAQNVTTNPPALFTHAVLLEADRVARPGEVPGRDQPRRLKRCRLAQPYRNTTP